MTSKPSYLLLFSLILLSLPIKWAAAQNMPWDIDIVPVVSRLDESQLPAVGTLSSVAAYNMPMLQWLHLPAWMLTHNAHSTILLTMLVFNMLSTIAVFCIGDSMIDKRAGLAAALLFTFSETGISSAYSAWAQLLLPGFYAMTLLFLWEWRRQEKGIYLAAAGVIATAAFMTHFSAILLFPAMLVFALLTRARWQWRWLLAGAFICFLMLAPYLQFDREHDFSNLRAFLTQETQVAPEVLAEVAYLKPENGPLPREQAAPENPADTSTPTPAGQTNIQNTLAASSPPFWKKLRAFAGGVPGEIQRGLSIGFEPRLRGLGAVSPFLTKILRPIVILPYGLFLIGSLFVIVQGFRRLRKYLHTQQQSTWMTISNLLVETTEGRLLLIVIFGGVILACLILTRSGDQPTYFMGLTSLQMVIAGATLVIIRDLQPRRMMTILALVVLISYAAINTAERGARLQQHDDSVYSRYNVSIYRHVSAAVDFIAEDWTGGENLTVSYDIMPEMRNLWWVAAWNSIDPGYRMGMNFDFLLAAHHGLNNTNHDPIGYVEEADYFVVYEPGLVRFTTSNYEIHQFGTISILKERR